MSDEVTYATLKFPNPSVMKKLQKNCSLKGTGYSNQWRVWGPVPFLVLMLNLAMMAGLGALILKNHIEFSFNNGTTDDRQQNIIEQLEGNTALYLDIYKSVSHEHVVLKNMLENIVKELNNLTSKYHENLKQKENGPNVCSSPNSCVSQRDNKKSFSSLRCDSVNNGNRTQLFIICLPSPVSLMKLNCTLTKTHKMAEDVSKFYNLTCLEPL